MQDGGQACTPDLRLDLRGIKGKMPSLARAIPFAEWAVNCRTIMGAVVLLLNNFPCRQRTLAEVADEQPDRHDDRYQTQGDGKGIFHYAPP